MKKEAVIDMSEIYEQEEASIDESNIEFAIKWGRGEKTEFFTTIPGEEYKLAVTACSLANNGGGQILLGVDKTGNEVGVESAEIEEKVKKILKQSLSRRLDTKYITTDVKIGGHTVIIIVIDEFKKYPLTADGRFYVRHQKENHLLTPDEVWNLMNRYLDAGDVRGI